MVNVCGNGGETEPEGNAEGTHKSVESKLYIDKLAAVMRKNLSRVQNVCKD